MQQTIETEWPLSRSFSVIHETLAEAAVFEGKRIPRTIRIRLRLFDDMLVTCEHTYGPRASCRHAGPFFYGSPEMINDAPLS